MCGTLNGKTSSAKKSSFKFIRISISLRLFICFLWQNNQSKHTTIAFQMIIQWVKEAKSGELCEPARTIFPQSVLILGQKGVFTLILIVLREI